MKKWIWLPLLLASCEISGRDIRVAEDRREDRSDVLRQALASPQINLRARAALAMGRVQSYLPDLVARLREERDSYVRRALLFAIGQCALDEDWKEGKETEAAEAVAVHLADSQPSTRVAAVEALGKLRGPKALERITPLLRDSTPEVRGEAALAIFRWRFLSGKFVPGTRKKKKTYPPLPPEMLNALISVAGDEDAGVRWRVAYAFTRFGDGSGLGTVRALATDASVWCRLFAIQALGRIQGEGAVTSLAAALRDPEYMVRTEAINALVMQKAWKALPSALAEDISFHVRAAYARALAGTDLEFESKLLKDPSLTVRCAALESWARRSNERADGDVSRALQDRHWKIRQAAAGVCRTVEMADEALKDADPRVRAAAIEALGGIGTEEALQRVVTALSDPDTAVRGSAIDTLPEFKKAPVAKLLHDTYRASPEHKFLEHREDIASALEEVPGDDATAALREILKDSEASVRAKARKALRSRSDDPGPDEARSIKPSFLIDIAFKSNPTVVFETERGVFEVECFADQAPIHVANIVHLAEQHFYDGLIIHRVVSNFVVQGGDPTGSGWGDAGYSVRDEINQQRYDRGTVGMPKAGKDTGGCQFFITHTPTPHLDGQYTVFGRVAHGIEVIDQLEEGDRILRARVRR